MNSLWDIRIFLGLVPKESHCINKQCFWGFTSQAETQVKQNLLLHQRQSSRFNFCVHTYKIAILNPPRFAFEASILWENLKVYFQHKPHSSTVCLSYYHKNHMFSFNFDKNSSGGQLHSNNGLTVTRHAENMFFVLVLPGHLPYLSSHPLVTFVTMNVGNHHSISISLHQTN